MTALVVHVEKTIIHILGTAQTIAQQATLTNFLPIIYALLLIIPYVIVLVAYFAQVVVAVFRVMFLASISPWLMMAYGFGFFRQQAIRGVSTLLAVFLVLWGSTIAIAVLVYHATLIHEIGRATGHAARLNRETGPVGSDMHDREELRAGMASYRLNTEIGLGHYPARHAGYAKGWVAAIEQDKNILFQAARDADRIVTYIMEPEKQLQLQLNGTQPDQEKEDPTMETPKPEQAEKTAQKKEPPKSWLNVPYDDKEEAKSKGAKWDRRAKSWYVQGEIPENLEKWRPSGESKPEVDPVKEFGQALRDHGLRVETDPIMDGNWRRVQVEGDRKDQKSGSYKGFIDGVPSGLIMNYKTGNKAHKWVSTGNELTESQLIELKREAGIRAQKQFEAMVEKHRETGKRAYGMWAHGVEVNQEHPYLQKKQIGADGMKMIEGKQTLMVPMQDIKGHIWSMQFIDEEGNKRFMKEGRKQGLFHKFGDPDQDKQLYIAEGVATAATIHHATGKPVLAAFDSGNLLPVAEAVRRQYPDTAIVIAADNDHNHAFGKNIGMLKAKEAAKAVAAAIVVPKFTDAEKEKGLTDFNDLAVERGLASLAGAVKPAQAKTAAQAL